MKIGTKSVLFGAHCFFIHPWFVALGWWNLYGFPFDPRLWVLFFVHDLGYIGKPNMDGTEGETHPELGARLMRVFDYLTDKSVPIVHRVMTDGYVRWFGYWGLMSLYHSRYYAKKEGAQPSRLCFADKLAIAYTPAWLYLPLVRLTGELTEYLRQADVQREHAGQPVASRDARKWYAQLREYMLAWVAKHKDGSEDTWTSADRHAKDSSGVTW